MQMTMVMTTIVKLMRSKEDGYGFAIETGGTDNGDDNDTVDYDDDHEDDGDDGDGDGGHDEHIDTDDNARPLHVVSCRGQPECMHSHNDDDLLLVLFFYGQYCHAGTGSPIDHQDRCKSCISPCETINTPLFPPQSQATPNLNHIC